jgi:quercetin dioxygenase-like cupin family protein
VRFRAPSSKTDKTAPGRGATHHSVGRSAADEYEGRDVRSWKYREVSTMSNEEAAPETKGVTAELLATVDLGPEIEGMAGRQLRMRMFTFEPGAVFGPIHDHKDRPGIVYILQGTITDHRNGAATDYGPGVGWTEDRNTTHWLENKGTVPAVEISVDITRFAQ